MILLIIVMAISLIMVYLGVRLFKNNMDKTMEDNLLRKYFKDKSVAEIAISLQARKIQNQEAIVDIDCNSSNAKKILRRISRFKIKLLLSYALIVFAVGLFFFEVLSFSVYNLNFCVPKVIGGLFILIVGLGAGYCILESCNKSFRVGWWDKGNC